MSNERVQASLSKRATNMGHKIPYVDIISDAILASPYRRLTAKEIFDQVSAKYGPMKSAETLKNTIRHTLSRYKVFRKVQRGKQKKPNWWTIDDDGLQHECQVENLQQDRSISDDYDDDDEQETPQNQQQQQQQQLQQQPHQQLQQLEVAGDSREYDTPSYAYQQPTLQQYPQLYFPQTPAASLRNGSGSAANETRVSVNAEEVLVPRTGYRAMTVSNPVSGASQGYGLATASESSTYLFPYEDPSANYILANGATAYTTSMPSPTPEYYQM